MTYDATEALELGKHASALIRAAGLEPGQVIRLEITPMNKLEIEAVLLSPDGQKLLAGDGVQSITKRLRIEWPK